MPDNDIVNRLKNNLVDFAILSAPIDTILFDAKYLFTHHFCCVVSTDHPLSDKEVLDYVDLKDRPLAIKGKEYSVYSLNSTRLLSHHIFPHIILETSSDQLIHKFAKENLAIGVTLDYLARQNLDNDTKLLYFKDENFSRDIFLCTQKNVTYSMNQQIFCDFLLDYINKKK